MGLAEDAIPPCLCDPQHKDVKYVCTKPPVTRIQCTCCGATHPEVVMYSNKRYPGRKFFKCKRCYAKRLKEGVAIGSFSCWDPEPPEFRTYEPKETEVGQPRSSSSDVSSSPTRAKDIIAQLDASLDVKTRVLITEELDAGFRYDHIALRNGKVCWTSLPKWLRDEFARRWDIAFEVFNNEKDAWAPFGLHTVVPVNAGPVRARIICARVLAPRVSQVIEIPDTSDDSNDDEPPAPVKGSPKRSRASAFDSDSDKDTTARASGSKAAKRVKGEPKAESQPIASSSKAKAIVKVAVKPAKVRKAKKTCRMSFGNPFKGKRKGE